MRDRRFDESKHGVNPARPLFGQPKHAQDKSCGLTAEIQARMERGQSAVGRDDVSRETVFRSGRLPPSFRFSLSFCGASDEESPHMKEGLALKLGDSSLTARPRRCVRMTQ